MRKGKKGALELSMSTIIIIVIGVVLLSLALFFVRSLFSQITEIKDDVFTRAKVDIENIGRSGKFSVSDIVRVGQGSTTTFPIYVEHDGSAGAGSRQFTIQLTPNGDFERVVKAKIVSPTTVTLQEGQEAKFLAQVVAVGNAPITTEASYQIMVTCDGCQDSYASGGVVIEVTERRGLFG